MKRHALRLLVLLFVSMSSKIHAREYLYPVASIKQNDNHYIYVMHQISLHHIQFLEWDVQSKVISQALPSFLTPAGIKILPDTTGYSFVNQGQLYIKLFSKRSAQRVDIPLPLCHLEMLEWLDAEQCYFTAQYNGQYAVYQLSRAGDLRCIVQRHDADCLYPQKIDSKLYFIERSFGKKKYSIKRSIYADAGNTLESVLNTGDQPIAFLHMISDTQGFYMSYPDSIESKASCLRCAYHQLTHDPLNAGWNSEKLFEFSIPLDLILPDSDNRLHESLLPVLPRHSPLGIYFCSCTSNSPFKFLPHRTNKNLGGSWYDPEFLKVYYYDLASKITTLATHDDTRDALSPLVVDKDLFYGHSIAGSSKHQPLLPGMWRNEHGQVCYETPKVLIS